jgi:hypothetical protein
MEKIRQRRVLHDVLLQVLADDPAGLPISDVYHRIDAQDRFPYDWYRRSRPRRGSVLKGLELDVA